MTFQRRILVQARIKVQENDHLCGAACAQSVLFDLNVERRQNTLYKNIRSYRTIDRGKKWFSAPDSLEKLLNDYLDNNRPPTITGNFRLYASTNKLTIARRMIWAFNQAKIPCVALILGGQHWITVDGYRLYNEENAERLPEYAKIKGFYVRDPMVVATQKFINYDLVWNWKRAIPVDSGHWHHKYIAICDPDPKKNIPDKKYTGKLYNPKIPMFMPEVEPPQIIPNKPEILPIPLSSPSKSYTQNPVKGGKKIIDATTTKSYASWWLHPGGFYDPGRMKFMMTNPTPGEPVLVQILGKKDFYYLVPVKDANQQIYAIMCMSAKNGNHIETSFSMSIKRSFSFTPLTTKKIENLVRSKYKKMKGVKEIPIHGSLVWKPCKQAQTIYQPFYMVTMGKSTVYIRIDGKMFNKLTDI